MSIIYARGSTPDPEDLLSLYDAVGWTRYTEDPGRLHSAVNGSLAVATAREEGVLVGLARLVGDGLTIVYLQDILVHPDHQRRGVGRELFRHVFAGFDDVREKVLIIDDEPRQRAFYEAMGFTEASALEHPLRTFVRLG